MHFISRRTDEFAWRYLEYQFGRKDSCSLLAGRVLLVLSYHRTSQLLLYFAFSSFFLSICGAWQTCGKKLHEKRITNSESVVKNGFTLSFKSFFIEAIWKVSITIGYYVQVVFNPFQNITYWLIKMLSLHSQWILNSIVKHSKNSQISIKSNSKNFVISWSLEDTKLKFCFHFNEG